MISKKNIEQRPYTDIDIKLSVFNTKSARMLLDIFKTIKQKRPSLIVHWLYDKKDKEMGMDYSELPEMEFDLSPN